MKSIMLLYWVCLFSIPVFSQVYQKNYLFNEQFTNDQPSHKWSIVNNRTYTANVLNGKYVCNLPYDNGAGWRWTWVGLPDALTQIFNQSEEISLDMDFTFEDDVDYNNFGLMFDLRDVTKNCPGGRFYELYFTRVKDSVQTAFRKNNNCRSGGDEYFKQGSAVSLQKINHLTIRKKGLQWTVLVNDSVTLNLSFSGKMPLDKLRYNKGRYTFDNFSAYSTTVTLPEAPRFAVEGSNTPKIWALCVGIENYLKYPGYPKYISDLKFCIDDAQAYYKFLSSFKGGKVPEQQMLLLTNDDATNDKILLKANELFAKAGDNDLVIVFLSGHGGSGYYCASNDALRYEELNKILENSKARRKLLIADACHSGTWAQKEVFTRRGKKLSDEEALQLFYSELAKSSRNVTYLLAARPDEFSWEHEERGGGIFTYYLVKGLSGEAENGHCPIITIEDIYSYLANNVYQTTRDYRDELGRLSPQHPILEGKYDKRMPVAICNK